MNEAVFGTLVGVASGWVLFQGTEALRTRGQNNAALRYFNHVIHAITTQVVVISAKLSQGQTDLAQLYIGTLPDIDLESFRDVSGVLNIKEMDFAADVVHHWNSIRRAEPSKGPDTTGVIMLDELLQKRIFLRRPFAWFRNPCKCWEYRCRIRELIKCFRDSPSKPEDESAKPATQGESHPNI